MTIRNVQKQTIFASDGFGLLQKLLELVTKRSASEDAGPPRRVDCEIQHWLERGWNIVYKSAVGLSYYK